MDGAVNTSAPVVKNKSGAARKGPPKGPQPALYRDPKTGRTWSGRGPAPTWLASAKDRTLFLIDQRAKSVGDTEGKFGAAAKKATTAKKTAAASKKVTAKKAVTKASVNSAVRTVAVKDAAAK